jgi:hypothetical protein
VGFAQLNRLLDYKNGLASTVADVDMNWKVLVAKEEFKPVDS